MTFATELKFIEAAEARLGIKLPDTFRKYLLKCNGGEIEILELDWELNPVLDDSDKEKARSTAIDIVHMTVEGRKWKEFPQRAVSVGDDGCGNHLVFLPDKQDASVLAPNLYIWWHEGGELEEVAKDFNDIIEEG